MCHQQMSSEKIFLFALKYILHSFFATELHKRHETNLDAVQIMMSLYAGLLCGL